MPVHLQIIVIIIVVYIVIMHVSSLLCPDITVIVD